MWTISSPIGEIGRCSRTQTICKVFAKAVMTGKLPRKCSSNSGHSWAASGAGAWSEPAPMRLGEPKAWRSRGAVKKFPIPRPLPPASLRERFSPHQARHAPGGKQRALGGGAAWVVAPSALVEQPYFGFGEKRFAGSRGGFAPGGDARRSPQRGVSAPCEKRWNGRREENAGNQTAFGPVGGQGEKTFEQGRAGAAAGAGAAGAATGAAATGAGAAAAGAAAPVRSTETL